jgi:hypothetical protein
MIFSAQQNNPENKAIIATHKKISGTPSSSNISKALKEKKQRQIVRKKIARENSFISPVSVGSIE